MTERKEIGERLQTIIQEAERRVFSEGRVYVGDPDRMSEEHIKETMRQQDQRAVDKMVIQIIKETWR